jgi:hypothetical protein
MIKISSAAVHRIMVSIIILMLACSVDTFAKNNCDANASLANPGILLNSGIGGTGITQSNIGAISLHGGGTGGTGNPEGGMEKAGNVTTDSGIGGTGIIGVITGFASICVNGVEIHYDAETAVSMDGRPSTIHDLATGQVVVARTLGKTHGLTATHIGVVHAVVGPISYFNPEIREMRILGQTIKTDSLRNHDDFLSLKVGDWAQVSGHRLADGAIVASRIALIPSLAEVGINGHVTQVDATGFEVNGTRIDYDARLLSTDISNGMEVRVAGHWDGAHLTVLHIQTEPTRQSIGNVERMVIDGYIHALNDNELNVNNQIVTFDSNTQTAGGIARSDLRLNQRIQVSGRLDIDQRVVVAERIELKHESTAHQLQEQERNDKSKIEGRGKDKRNLSEIKLIKEEGEEGNNQSHHNGHADDSKGSLTKEGDGNKDSLKNEMDPNENKNSSSDSGSRFAQVLMVIMIILVLVIGLVMILKIPFTNQNRIK